MDVKQFSSDKILGHLDRIKQWIDTGTAHPVTFELDMTNICNHSCPYCFGFYSRNNRESLTLDEAGDIIRQIKDFGGRGLTFTGGGEPLCNPATVNAVEFAKGIGLDIGFITNGILIDEGIAERLIKNCTWIRISLDAASARMFRITHGMDTAAFDKVIENIGLLVEKKKDINGRCTIGVGYLTALESKNEIYKFAKLCQEMKVDYAQFRPLLPRFGRNKISYSRTGQSEIIKQIKKSLKLSKDGYQVLYSKHKYDSMLNGETQRPYKECFGHHFAAVICANKKMYICCHFRGVEKYCIGDLRQMSLKEIWQSRARRKAYEDINLKECIPLCRCNTFNSILWNIKQEKIHPNFI